MQLRLAEIDFEIVQKDIKNVHLGVYPPNGRVRVAAPVGVSLPTLRAFLVTKLSWVREEQRKFREQVRFTKPIYVDRESHYLWGDRVLLEVHERREAPKVRLEPGRIKLYVRPGADSDKRREVLEQWYRDVLRDEIEELLPQWQRKLGVNIERFFVRRMKTRWGSCNPKRRTIRVNTELARKPRRCLEYIVVHELMHLHESTHNERFKLLMDRHLPSWRESRKILNEAPLAYEEWGLSTGAN